MKYKVLTLLTVSTSLWLVGANETTRIPGNQTFIKVVADSTKTNDLLVTDNATIQRDLTVDGDTTILGDITIAGSIGIAGDITVTGDITARDITATRDISVGEDLSVARDLDVTQDTHVFGDLTVDGDITFTRLTAQPGVVHNDASGLLSSSAVVNADIQDATITNAKLAAIAVAATQDTLVLRDASGDFAANIITAVKVAGLNTPSDPTDAANKQYVTDAIAAGISYTDPVLTLSAGTVTTSGLQTIDGVTLVDGNRVLVVGPIVNGITSAAIQNGIWVAHIGAWTRPTDFNTGNPAGTTAVLTNSGNVWVGSGWRVDDTSAAAIIGTNPIKFIEVSAPNNTSAANVGTGAGSFLSKSGNILNFRSITNGSVVTAASSGNQINLGIANGSITSAMIADGTIVNADISASAAIANSKLAGAPTTSNTPNTIVLRDSHGAIVESTTYVTAAPVGGIWNYSIPAFTSNLAITFNSVSTFNFTLPSSGSYTNGQVLTFYASGTGSNDVSFNGPIAGGPYSYTGRPFIDGSCISFIAFNGQWIKAFKNF